MRLRNWELVQTKRGVPFALVGYYLTRRGAVRRKRRMETSPYLNAYRPDYAGAGYDLTVRPRP